MTTYSLPQPGAQLKRDARGFTDPMRYTSQRRSPGSSPPTTQAGAGHTDALPGVEHILKSPTYTSYPPPYGQNINRVPHSPSSLSSEPIQSSEYYSRPGSRQSRTPTFQQFPHSQQLQRGSYGEQSRPRHRSSAPQASADVYQYQPLSGRSTDFNESSRLKRLEDITTERPPPFPRRRALSDVRSDPNYAAREPSKSLLNLSQGSSGENAELSDVSDPRQPDLSSSTLRLQPRVIGEDFLVGQGEVYIFEDGSTCPKSLGGEPVNPNWGITKAGKPRKRLAVACTTCREKKIKCDPAEPKCAQCDKFGRDCHYASTSRVARASPESQTSGTSHSHGRSVHAQLDKQSKRSLLPSALDTLRRPDFGYINRQSVSPGRHDTRLVSTPQRSESPPYKKRRSDETPQFAAESRYLINDPERFQGAIQALPADPSPATATKRTSWGLRAVAYDWTQDPRRANPEATRHYLDLYFSLIEALHAPLLPKESFISWFDDQIAFSKKDRMLVYAMIAFGASFSSKSEDKLDSQTLIKIARQSIEKSRNRYSTQCVHTQILLALCFFASGDCWLAWDYVGGAIRAVTGLRLNSEEGCKEVQEGERPENGLTEHGMAEYRRRLFWSVFVLDRYSGFSGEHLSILQKEDAHLRLPCNDDEYLRQFPSNAPFFDNGFVDPDLCTSDERLPLSSIAQLVQLISIWGDVNAYSVRRSRQEIRRYASDYESFYDKTMERLQLWIQGLPEDARSDFPYIKSADKTALGERPSAAHYIYHAIIIKLNRSFHHERLSQWTVTRNITKAREHAQKLLQMLEVVKELEKPYTPNTSADGRGLRTSPGSPHPFSFNSIPFIVYSTMLTVDVLSAGGSFPDSESSGDLLASMSMGLWVSNEVGAHWKGAEHAEQAISSRVRSLQSITGRNSNSPVESRKRAWRFRKPMDRGSKAEQDAFYPGNDDAILERFFDQLQIPVQRDEILFIDI